MLGIGWGEMVALLIVGLVIVGPDRLPQVAFSVARALKQAREWGQSIQQEFTQAVQPQVRQFQHLASLGQDIEDIVGGDDLLGHAALTAPAPLYLDAT